MHGGQQYHVDRLDWKEKKAYVRQVDVDYYTDANLAVDLEVLESCERDAGRGVRRRSRRGRRHATWRRSSRRSSSTRTRTSAGARSTCPQEDMHTTAYWLALEDATAQGLGPAELQDGLWGMAHLLARHRAALPDVRPEGPAGRRPGALALHRAADALPLREATRAASAWRARLFEAHSTLLRSALDLAKGCPCADGCPSCVGPGVESGPDSKRSAITLLERLSHGTA